MSTVMRPRGPLPPRVYWTRRVLLVAVVMIFGALLWWVMPGVGGSGNAAANPSGQQPQRPSGQQPSTTPTTPTSTTGTNAGSGPAGHEQSPGPTQHSQSTTSSHPTVHPPTSTPPAQGHQKSPRRVLPAPSGPCDPKKLAISVVVPNAPIGNGTTVGLRMATGDGSTCSLGITPSLLDTRITSGGVVVWQSTSCPDALPARNVVVRPEARVVYSYTWDGQVNPDSCSASDRLAQEGGYWAEAALIGGEPSKTYFEVTAATTS